MIESISSEMLAERKAVIENDVSVIVEIHSLKEAQYALEFNEALIGITI